MSRAIVGAQRTGKTYLCTILNDRGIFPFLVSQVAKILDQRNVDASEAMDFNTRISAQEALLDAHIVMWETSEHDYFVTDRTPLDFIMYTLHYTNPSTAAQKARVNRYIDRCYEVTNKYFGEIFVLQPGIEIVETTKNTGKLCMKDMLALNDIMVNLVRDSRLKSSVLILHKSVTDIEERVKITSHVKPLNRYDQRT